MKNMQHNFKKKFGQNFLIDKNIINHIISKIDLQEDDLVIEIGPGSGALTKELVKKCRVLAYEIDLDLKNVLLSEINNNLFVIWDDFLKRNISSDLKDFNYKNLYVIANLPYYITTPIINKIVDSKLNINNILIMVQNEVADRFCSMCGSKDYSSITVYLNYFFDVKKEFKVSKNCFYPIPKVDSAVISLKPINNKYKVKNEEVFFNLIRDSFKYKRKTIKNNLKEYDLKKINFVLEKNGFDLNIRAESLPIEVFVEIANIL